MCYFKKFNFFVLVCTFIVENHDDPHNAPSPPPPFLVNSMEYTGDDTGVAVQNETYIKMTHLLDFIYFIYKLRFSPKELQ